MILLKDYIRENVIPDYIIDNDSYKDGDGRGFVERYLSIFGMELDEFYYPLVDQLQVEFDPLTMQGKFLDYVGYQIGDIPNITHTEAGWRRLLSYIVSIWKIKGTLRSFRAILLPLQVIVTDIEEIVPLVWAYDMGLKYDTGVKYDLHCPQCSEYNLTVTSIFPLTAELYQRILGAIALVEPINFKLKGINYNGDAVDVLHIDVWVDEHGDLIYDNDADPTLILTLTPEGNLLISGPNAGRYFLDSEGDLYYIDF